MQGNDSSYEKQLWNSFLLNGTEESLEAIYSIYFPRLHNFGYKYVSDTTLIEDCIQDLFIKILQTRERLAEPDSVKNYLYTIFRNMLIDKMRQHNKMNYSELDETADYFQLSFSAESRIIENESDDEMKKKLQQSIGQLTGRQREAIFLRFYEGFSYPETAEILQMSTKATYKLMARAIDSLRETIASVFFLYSLLFR